MLKRLLNFNLPLWSVLALFLSFAMVGYAFFSVPKAPVQAKFATLNKAAIVYGAIAENPRLTEEQIQKQFITPINNLLKKYQDDGYVVIDLTKDDDGNYVINAIPKDAINLDKEFSEAIKNHP